jgi:hypothetical protein
MSLNGSENESAYYPKMLSRSTQLKRFGFKPRLATAGFSTLGKGKTGSKRLRAGKRTKEWIAVRHRLKVRFEAMGIMVCELNYPGCHRDGSLGFAHGRKRRHLKGDELKSLVILTCNHCHDAIEYLGSEPMLEIVQDVIASRELAA